MLICQPSRWWLLLLPQKAPCGLQTRVLLGMATRCQRHLPCMWVVCSQSHMFPALGQPSGLPVLLETQSMCSWTRWGTEGPLGPWIILWDGVPALSLLHPDSLTARGPASTVPSPTVERRPLILSCLLPDS